jgi:SAM-dependent methyltransferase
MGRKLRGLIVPMADQSCSQVSTAMLAVESYSQRANPDFEAELALRTAAKEGAFFLRFLRPGMRVLDLGCGPGSITLGLAETVAPGEVVGIDSQPSQVAQAQALSAARGVVNARFECCRCLPAALSRWLLRRRLCQYGVDASARTGPSAGGDASRAPRKRHCLGSRL